jgi:hypothetical protein
MTRLTPAQLTPRRMAYYANIRALAPMMANKGWKFDKSMGMWLPMRASRAGSGEQPQRLVVRR